MITFFSPTCITCINKYIADQMRNVQKQCQEYFPSAMRALSSIDETTLKIALTFFTGITAFLVGSFLLGAAYTVARVGVIVGSAYLAMQVFNYFTSSQQQSSH